MKEQLKKYQRTLRAAVKELQETVTVVTVYGKFEITDRTMSARILDFPSVYGVKEAKHIAVNSVDVEEIYKIILAGIDEYTNFTFEVGKYTYNKNGIIAAAIGK